MFKGKYLKYSPEITFEIFELVWNKLIQSGIEPGPYDKNVKDQYHYYTSGHYYLRISDCGSMGVYNFSTDLAEITVQEILGYDPFVKDEFVLPENWCVKASNKEEDDILIKWRGAAYIGKIGEYYMLSCKYWCGSNIGYPEITFDQFKKYVLKKTVEEPKEVIPEYVEYIKSDDTGKIVKVSQWTNHAYCKVEFPDGTIKEPFKHLIKSSTKEAYDAQNNPKPIEKWGVGSYVVFCKESDHKQKIGTIDVITQGLNSEECVFCKKYPCLHIGREKDGEIKWFATKQEAEDFSFALKYPFKPLRPGDLDWEVQVPNPYYGIIHQPEISTITTNNLEYKTILTIDEEELPMVSIIKTKTIKQLENYD